MNLLLDTCVVSELRKRARAAKGLREWVRETHGGRHFICVITLLELERGVLRLERKDALQGAILREWLDGQVREAFRGRILPFDEAAAPICAGFHVPDPRSECDAMIAAVAVAHQMPLVTRNVADFQSMKGLKLINPWESGSSA